MVYSANLRKIIILLGFVIFGALIVVRVVQRYHLGNECFLSLENEIDLAELAVSQSGFFPEENFYEGYNFANMLKLIDLAQYIKGTLRGAAGVDALRKKVNRDEAAQILQALTSERAALRDYIWDLKGHSRNSIPHKRYRSLMYYLEVLDGLVTEMREFVPSL